MIVVKVGGSLYDSPKLGPALREFVAARAPSEVVLVPGGGAVADAVRALDRTHALGEEAAHWVALRALSVTTAFLEALLAEPLSPPFLGERFGGRGLRVLDPFAFMREDESRPGALPHTWSVTTDSIAARAAIVFRAERLVLLKSVDIPLGTPWTDAAANGWVDAHFPRIAPMLACPVETVNFRAKLGADA